MAMQGEVAPSAREVAGRFLAATTGSLDDLADLYAPHVTIEMPFAAPLYPTLRQVSRDELRAQFRAGAASRKYTRVENVIVHETADPAVVIVEYNLHGDNLGTGQSFAMPILMIITVHDGLITTSRDYSSPVAGAIALGRLPELIEALNRN
jgi:uncharacterized protein